jgi:uncharacterized protein DUF1153
MNDNRRTMHVNLAAPFASGEDCADPSGALPGPAADLPSPDTKRWVVRRKAVVVHAVRSGEISLQEAYRRYRLSEEEFLAWQHAIERYGIPGLRATRLQIYRNTDVARSEK